MLNSRQRAFLRGLGNDLSAVIQIGKDSCDKNMTDTFLQYLSKREMVKVNVLKNCELTPGEVAEKIANEIGAEVVQVIGNKFILYKPNIELMKIGKAITLPN